MDSTHVGQDVGLLSDPPVGKKKKLGMFTEYGDLVFFPRISVRNGED